MFASVVRFPDRHDRNRSCGMVPVLPADPCGWPLYWFCGGHGPGETPGPFPNPEAKAWHGDGTALERVWESSTPPHSTSGFPSSVTLREPPFLFVFRFPGDPRARRSGNPFFFCLLCRPAGWSPDPGVSGRTVRGSFWTSVRLSHMSKRLDWSYGKSYGV